MVLFSWLPRLSWLVSPKKEEVEHEKNQFTSTREINWENQSYVDRDEHLQLWLLVPPAKEGPPVAHLYLPTSAGYIRVTSILLFGG